MHSYKAENEYDKKRFHKLKTIEMAEEKKYYILGNVYHQDDTSPVELLGEAATPSEASTIISRMMNDCFFPKNIFVIEGVKRDIEIKGVSLK